MVLQWVYSGWFDTNNLFYASSMEIIKGAMHEFAIPVVHIAEVFIVLWVANKMIKYDEHKKS